MNQHNTCILLDITKINIQKTIVILRELEVLDNKCTMTYHGFTEV